MIEFDNSEISEKWKLTKREYFAIRALQGLLANGTLLDSEYLFSEDITEDAVAIADFLINELSKQPKEQ